MRRLSISRRRTVGAEIVPGGVDFRVWAPDHSAVSAVIDGNDFPLDAEPGGYFRDVVAGASAGTRYRFRLGDGDAYPDPASRFQPDGPHGDSEVIDPSAYEWKHDGWEGLDADHIVLYELHAGTFTPEGTWRAAIPHLPALREIGITAIELMPVNEFGGAFGWGYDGVDPWAPMHTYGRPDDLRAFVDAAHAARLGVILDVVYNHLGPDGCYLAKFSARYFTKQYENDWGDSVNFDGDGSEGVREFFSENAAHWIDEYHLDGLRLDATQAIIDHSPEHVLALVTRRAREAAPRRTLYLAAENEPQDVRLVEEYGVDAMWNDDWHHSAMVAATGRAEAYYSDYRGSARELVSMALHGFLYQGQRYAWQKHRRGTPSLRLPPRRLICYLQNHDQIANSARGERLHQITSPGRFRALTALLLLAPQTPLLFQGEEFAASSPFLYFADHPDGELAGAVAKGRREFLAQFPSIDSISGSLAPPHARETFERCKLDHRERETHAEAVALHRDLLLLRRDDPAFGGELRGAVLAEEAFVLRFGDSRLLLVNLGRDLLLDCVPEPLLAPPRGGRWQLLWSSEAAEYGGGGTAEVEDEEGRWRVGGHSAAVMGVAG